MSGARFVDRTGSMPTELDPWPPVVIPRAQLDAEVARLAAPPAPANGRRRSFVAHERAGAPGWGLAPGIRVSLDVLLPGERTEPIRHNSSGVSFCIAGSGHAEVGAHVFSFERFDVWHLPSMTTYTQCNDGDELQVLLTYTNAALLEQMNVHVVEDPAVEADDKGDVDTEPGDVEEQLYREHVELDGGAFLMSYEELINPRVVQSRPLHWPWARVREQLDGLAGLGADYRGRRLVLLYNPATGRTNGTSMNLFATMTVRPPDIVDRPHRHVAAAINYYMAGSGYSRVGGRKLEWSAGDLMFSAPGWVVHHHASGPELVYELTVQDSPLNLAMDSLLWQEDLTRPPILLGSSPGFRTNRSELRSRPS